METVTNEVAAAERHSCLSITLTKEPVPQQLNLQIEHRRDVAQVPDRFQCGSKLGMIEGNDLLLVGRLHLVVYDIVQQVVQVDRGRRPTAGLKVEKP